LSASGTLSNSDAAVIASLAASGGLSSLQELDSLPSEVQTLVRNAFRDGLHWSFLSIVPWAAIAFVPTLWLSNIQSMDRPAAGASEPARGTRSEDILMHRVEVDGGYVGVSEETQTGRSV
jgi:hypothetical protein